jgi:hypothetical protein
MGREGKGRERTGRDRTGSDGTGRDGMGRDGKGREGTERDGTSCMRRDSAPGAATCTRDQSGYLQPVTEQSQPQKCADRPWLIQ